MDLGAELIGAKNWLRGNLDAIAGGRDRGQPVCRLDRRPGCHCRMASMSESSPRGLAADAQIEGELGDGARVLLVGGLASEGTSKLNFVAPIRQAGRHIPATPL